MKITIRYADPKSNFKSRPFITIEQLLRRLSRNKPYDIAFYFQNYKDRVVLTIDKFVKQKTYTYDIEGKQSAVVAVFEKLVEKLK